MFIVTNIEKALWSSENPEDHLFQLCTSVVQTYALLWKDEDYNVEH